MKTVAWTPCSRAAQATAWPWLPALAATTPASRSAAESPAILLTAPRILKEPVRWRFSAFSCTSRPVRRLKVSEPKTGVTRAIPSRRRRASSISRSPGAVRVAISRILAGTGRKSGTGDPEDSLHDLADRGQRVELPSLHLVQEPSQL